MSRIIVKNLPSKATESDVKAFFSPKGDITDVKVLRKRDGSSRRFAFVGFKSDSQAEEAAKYFDMSFMNSSRLQVSLAKPLGDEELEKRKENLKRKRIANAEAADPKLADAKKKPVDNSSNAKNAKDEKLDEFLKVMQPQKSTAMWKNDNTDSAAPATTTSQANGDDEEDVNDMSKTAQPIDADSNVPQEELNGEETHSNEEEMQDAKPAAEEEEEEDWNPEANLEESEDDNEEKAALTDDEWLRQRQTRIKENGEKPKPLVEEENIEDESEDENENNNETDGEALTDPQGAGVEPTNRLFVRNLAFTVSRIDLQELFGQFGTLMQVHIPLDPKTDKSKGIAFIEYDEVSSSQEALEALDGKSFQGRLLHIIYATEQRNYELDEFDIKQMPLKKQKALRRRMQASRQQFSWNSLYMNKDTVLEATAAKLNVSKSELLDPHSSNMAVQQALAESSVLENVQNYFKSKHVDLAKFQSGKSQELSDNVILVKNLPFGVSALEIQDMFAQYGPVERTLMPPDGGIAIVQYKLGSDGRHAFKKLAFRRIGESILYLQKAPKGAVPDVDSSAAETKPAEAGTTEASAAAAAEAGPAAADILLPGAQEPTAEDEADVRTSVFVKNLNFSTTLPSLIKLFQAVPGYISAVIKMKPDPKDSKKQLSMGFGFVEFRTLSQAQTAVKTLNNTDLDGHKLQLKISTRGQDGGSSAPSQKKLASQGRTKIVIKNIPFETSKQDIVELFGTFGHLRSVRVPRKFNRQTRGFAFAEFATPKEAEHAMESLRGAHLLGRRLVMDYAEADAEDAEDEIARMEAKVSQQVNAVDTQSRRLGGQQKGFDMDEE